MSPRVTRINLIAVVIVSSALILYTITGLLQAFVLDSSYPLFVELPDAAGLRENKEVAYNGHPVGRIAAVTATDHGARIELAMEEGIRIPHDVNVVVLRRSPIGEQALDLRPVGPAPDAVEFEQVAANFYEPGATIDVNELVLPPEVQELFETAVRVLEPVDAENTGALISELADTVRGRRDDIRGILQDSADFSEAIADEGEDYDRLFASSRVVNAELAEHRETLAGLFTDLRESTSILSDGRDEFEQLLATAPPVLTRFGDFVERAQPNIACSLNDFANFNQMTAQPDNLESAAEALRHNQLFFVGFEAVSAFDPAGRNWFRVHVVGEQQGPPPDSYLPDKRPINDIRPGGACDSEFGPGAPAATQVDYSPRVPEAEIDRPANDRIRTVTQFGGFPASSESGTDTDTGTDAAAPAAAPLPAGPLPATGGAGVSFLLGVVMIGGALAVVRRGGWRD